MQTRLTERQRVSDQLFLLRAWVGGSHAISVPALHLHALSASPQTTIQNF
ncbi:hypothetical protein [Devosia sp. SL43]|nr:hypothetical protein [Devosia sp. SL43]UJW87099.1 hypothetical protein IM737_07625 [Devosia sp. SL43]